MSRFDEVKKSDHEREPVPENERKGWFQLSIVWVGAIIALSATALGGAIGGGMSLPTALIATFVGCFLLATLSALCTMVGAKTGLSTTFVSMFSLGKKGAYAVSIVIAIALFGWFGVQLELFGSSAHYIIQQTFGVSINVKILTVIGGILMVSTAFIGYRAIEKLSLIAVPLLAILLVASLFKVMSNYSFSEVINSPLTTDPLPLGSVISLIIGSLAIGAVIGPDISRYAKTTKDAIISSYVGFFIGYAVILIIAIFLSKATSETDIVAIMLGVGWGTVAMLVLILAQWTTNDNNLYSAALSFSVILTKTPKAVLTLIAGIIGIVMAVSGIYSHFTLFLTFLSVLIPPIGGIYVGDYLINKNKYSYDQLETLPNFNFIGLGIWAISTLIAFMTTASPIGFGWFNITGASGLDAFLVALIVQMVASFVLKKNIVLEGAGNEITR